MRTAFTGLILWLCIALLGFSPRMAEGTDLEVCSSCSIYILDLSTLAQLHGFPSCNLNNLKVDPANGVVYLKDQGPSEKVEHFFGTHSAPWFLYKAIQNSNCLTEDIESADLVYVYDYCYYTWWLAHAHSVGRDVQDTPGDYLIKGWTAMSQLPRWKKNGGRDFVFYDPHPAFVTGRSAAPFDGMLCNEFRHSTHIVVERAQRNKCQSYLEISKQIITPYVPNVVDTSDPLETFLRPGIPRNQRTNLIYFSGKCQPYRGKNVGKKMRHAMVQALQDKADDIDIKCSESQGEPDNFESILEKMEHSVFCLVVPGDAQSSRRLSEIFMAGCIPVFLGPPYNTMPLAEDVSYKSLGVFFNISNYHSWLPTEMQWSIGSERARSSEEARWWIPDADVYERIIPVDSLKDIMAHLRGMPEIEISRKLKEMQAERLRFTFQGNPAKDDNAVRRIIKHLSKIASASGNHGKSSRPTLVERKYKDSKSSDGHIDARGRERLSGHDEKAIKGGAQSEGRLFSSFLDGAGKSDRVKSSDLFYVEEVYGKKQKDSDTEKEDANQHNISRSYDPRDSGAGMLKHDVLGSDRQNQSALNISGAIRRAGDSWQPFDVQQLQ